jgi:hypothetical protein
MLSTRMEHTLSTNDHRMGPRMHSLRGFNEHSNCRLFSISGHVLTYVLLIRQPIVTGTSVLAIKYKDGIMMAADNLGTFLSYTVIKTCFLTTSIPLPSFVWITGQVQGRPTSPFRR